MTLFVLILLPVLLSLGSWQLQRGAQKQALQLEYLSRAGALPTSVSELVTVDRAQLAFARLRLTGRYLPGAYYLIDNQVRGGQVGYFVVHCFESADKRLWLLNRGFVAAGERREQWPVVATPVGQQTLVALVWPDTGLVPLLAAEPEFDGWPKLKQRMDPLAMASEHTLGQPLELRLEPGQPGVLLPAPSVFASGAERHRGYAVQWFMLAAILLAGFVIYGRREGARTALVQD